MKEMELVRRAKAGDVKVGRTWAIAEDDLLRQFKERLKRIKPTRMRRSLRLKAIWEIEPEKMKLPPKRRVRLVAKVSRIWLEPLGHQIPTENDPLCPS